MNEAVLEIVIVWKDEPMMELMATLDMFQMQRNVNRDDYVITIVADQKNEDADIAEALLCTKMQKFRFDFIKNESVGGCPPDSFNQRILRGRAPWIMFMGCGDMMADVYSLSMILNLLPTDEFDVLWTEYYGELKREKGKNWVSVIGEDGLGIEGKLFRRAFLLKNGLLFDRELTHDAGDVFFSNVRSMLQHSRYSKISTKFVPYLHVDPGEDERPTVSAIVWRRHETNMAIVRNMKGHRYFRTQALMRAICDAYCFMYTEPVDQDIKKKIADGAMELYAENAELIRKIKEEDIEVYVDDARRELLQMCNNAFVRYGYEMYFDLDRKFEEWLAGGLRADEVGRVPKDKVAVFCGTRNVYDCMETAAKSLMAHTKMDRVYFLIEDDKFPGELPEVIRCINVSGQTWFDPKGKNYENAWTYMCLMRAAFAKLLPEEKQVLSLDIDVVVNEDISELWDIDLKNWFYAGVPEVERTEKLGTAYCNFGVIMMNLELMRRTKVDDVIIASLNRDRWGCPEQDAFNHFCAGRIYALPSMYNATRAGHITAETELEKISHYAGIKYWKQFKPFKKYAGMSWEEVMGK